MENRIINIAVVAEAGGAKGEINRKQDTIQ